MYTHTSLTCGRFTELLRTIWPLTAGRQRPGLISNKDINSWTDTGGWSSSLSSPTMTREINEHVCLSVHTHIVGDHSLDGNYTWQNPWFLTWTLQASGWRFHSFIQNMQFSATHVMAFQSSLTCPENKTIRDIWLRPEVTRSVWCVCVCVQGPPVLNHTVKLPPKRASRPKTFKTCVRQSSGGLLITASCTSAAKCFVCPVDFCSMCVSNGAD